jgi:hypothetical protein
MLFYQGFYRLGQQIVSNSNVILSVSDDNTANLVSSSITGSGVYKESCVGLVFDRLMIDRLTASRACSGNYFSADEVDKLLDCSLPPKQKSSAKDLLTNGSVDGVEDCIGNSVNLWLFRIH